MLQNLITFLYNGLKIMKIMVLINKTESRLVMFGYYLFSIFRMYNVVCFVKLVVVTPQQSIYLPQPHNGGGTLNPQPLIYLAINIYFPFRWMMGEELLVGWVL